MATERLLNLQHKALSRPLSPWTTASSLCCRVVDVLKAPKTDPMKGSLPGVLAVKRVRAAHAVLCCAGRMACLLPISERCCWRWRCGVLLQQCCSDAAC